MYKEYDYESQLLVLGHPWVVEKDELLNCAELSACRGGGGSNGGAFMSKKRSGSSAGGIEKDIDVFQSLLQKDMEKDLAKKVHVS